MNKAFWLVMIIVLGAFSLVIINLVGDYTSRSEADYYLLKDTTEAAMVDALDIAYYKISGEFKINKEKFIESFVRRFSESVKTTKNYNLRFYDISEIPPKVSIQLGTATSATFSAEDLNIVSRLDGILETSYDCTGILPYDEGKCN